MLFELETWASVAYVEITVLAKYGFLQKCSSGLPTFPIIECMNPTHEKTIVLTSTMITNQECSPLQLEDYFYWKMERLNILLNGEELRRQKSQFLPTDLLSIYSLLSKKQNQR